MYGVQQDAARPSDELIRHWTAVDEAALHHRKPIGSYLNNLGEPAGLVVAHLTALGCSGSLSYLSP